ncbi:MAG: hypothetical protein NVSMB45_17920 [Ginsengibacter sp.]
MLAANFSCLKSNAVSSNSLSVNNSQFYDVANRTQSPYEIHTVFAASPMFETSDNGKISLIFKQNLFVNNTGKTVSNISVNFDDGGGYVSASWNTSISYTYLSTGNKRLTIKLDFTDGTSLLCYSSFNVSNTLGNINTYQPTSDVIPFNPTTNHSGGDITVRYSVNNNSPTSNRKLKKPFIVVEGFDMHDAAPLLISHGYNYENFRNELLDATLNNSQSFNYNLDNLGSYDLIFLNYRDGTDDIIRNAALLEDVINWVNSNRDVSSQPSVVMGISMGGLVSRYCLAKMTKQNSNPPQVRLLITHDSPHRGANIPLGMQYLINDFANKKILRKPLKDWIPAIKQVVELQVRPATMQQLIVRDNPISRALEYNTFLAEGGPYRKMVTFLSTDHQPAYTFIATSQGSECGVPTMQPYAQIAHTSGNVNYSFLMGLSSAHYSGEVTINALPNNEAPQRITYLDITETGRFLYFPTVFHILHFEHYSPNGILAYDGAPAGTQGIPAPNVRPIHASNDDIISWFFSSSLNFNGLQTQKAFSFLPTVSALDEGNINATSLYASHIGANYISPSDPTLLKKYVAHEKEVLLGFNVYNRQHTDFTNRESQWIYNEMESIQNIFCFDDLCDDPQITGPVQMCNGNQIYAVNQVPPGSNITWSSTPSGIVQQSCTNCNQVTLSQIATGLINLTATVNAPCGSRTISLNRITVGYPQAPLDIVGMDPSTYLGAGSTITLSVNEEAPSYDWQVAGGAILGSSTGRSITVRLDNCYTGQETLNDFSASVRLQNDCGLSAFYTESTHATCGGVTPFSMAIAPNPVTTTDLNAHLNINDLIKKKEIKEGDRVTATLYDITTAKAIKQWILTSKQDYHKLSVSGIKKGQYLLEVTVGDKKVSKQVSIQ